jgi:hypothetical protein
MLVEVATQWKNRIGSSTPPLRSRKHVKLRHANMHGGIVALGLGLTRKCQVLNDLGWEFPEGMLSRRRLA